MPEILDNTILAALFIGLFVGYYLGRLPNRISKQKHHHHPEDHDYYDDEAAKTHIAQLSSDGLIQVQDAIFRGRKIEAIKHFRQDTNLSLKNSKEAVEYMMQIMP